MTIRTSRSAIGCALLATTCLSLPSVARAADPAPVFVGTDANGVDLTTGLVQLDIDEGGIGSGEGAVRMKRIWAQGAGWVDNWSGGLFKRTSGSVTKIYVQIAGISDTFSGSGTTWTADKADGATLTIDAQGFHDYTARDGTKIRFQNSWYDNTALSCSGANPASCRVPLSITRPNGLKFVLDWQTGRVCDAGIPGEPGCLNPRTYQRLSKVTSSAGYSLSIAYASSDAASPDWFKRTTVAFGNSANASSPAPTIAYATPATGIIEVRDPANRTWRFAMDTSGRLTNVRRPGNSADNISYAYGTNGLVSAATKDGVTTNYFLGAVGVTAIMTITNALNEKTKVSSNLSVGRPTSVTNWLNQTTSYAYEPGNGRLQRTTAPEGNYVELTYDGRGNITQTKQVPKGGVGSIVTSASFDASCSNPVKCNKPNSTTDARGQTTDYAYDPAHGGIKDVTAPAPSAGAVRPQIRYSYTQIPGAGGQSVYMLTGTSTCQKNATCGGTVDESKVTTAYNSNLLPTTVTSGDGAGTLAATSTASYDARGNVFTVDGPLSETADTTRYRYDNADQLVGIVFPDPDGPPDPSGAGVLKHRAVRVTYRPDGQVSKRELGTVGSQSDADWPSMNVLESVETLYDVSSRPATERLFGGTSRMAQTQRNYDALGRLQCTALRMNRAAFSTYPDACVLGAEGADGPDRITKLIYDAAGRVTQNRVAVGTPDEAAERTLAYTSNGQLQTLTDGETNKTTYEYDGYDRLIKTLYPNKTKGAGVSAADDFEQLGYDDNGNVVSRTLRDGQPIAFTFDFLNRATFKNLPGTEPDVTYGYNNYGQLTSASQTGHALSFTYDALGRNQTQVGPQGTATPAWDLAGRRTRLTYPGTGLTVDYDYLLTGEVTKVRENGATSGVGVLATYTFDDLGRRTRKTFGNGVVQAYTYDAVSRLASLSNDLTGTTNDLTASFERDPASRISSTIRTGDSYAFTELSSATTSSPVNGLNQLISVNGAQAAHDSRGNLTLDPSSGKAYGYSSENMLTSASGGVTLTYDPLLRLYQVTGSAAMRFAYDGLNAIAEYNASNALQRRFVHGPGDDEPIVQYEGTGTATRRFLSADERGSIVSVSDGVGAILSTNRYDEFGKLQTSNVGRFQYTGQMWLPEIGLYHYKARMYAPHFGRFMQTDPIGYADGPNWYNYVGSDPVNNTDPSGLCLGVGSECPTPDGVPVTPEGPEIIVTASRNSASVFPLSPAVALSGLMRTGIIAGMNLANLLKQQNVCPAPGPSRAPASRRHSSPNWTRPGWQVIFKTGAGIRSLLRSSGHNDASDAWRHFRWSFSMAQTTGDTAARDFLEHHERAVPNPPGEARMDATNNAMGLAFANDPRYKNMDPDDAANLALAKGCLQTGVQ